VAQPSDPRFVIHVTGDMIRHSRILDLLYFGGFLYGIIELLAILMLGISARMRDLASRVTRRPYLIALIYVVQFTIVTAVLDFPFSYYAGYVVPHQFNLSNQNFTAWIGDETKALLVGLVSGLLVVPLGLLVIRKVKRWWLAFWFATIPLSVLVVVIVPVVVDPLFNRFEPLEDQVLRQKLLDEAARAGIEGGRVYQVDKSRQTKEMNAYVTGLGPTKRIVMWDTLLQKMSQDEILAVMGHEMGHYVLHHMWQGVAWTVAIAFPVLFFAQRVYERGIGRWGLAERGDAASLPWLLLIVSTISFLLSPVENGISRHIEHQADVFGLELTHLNEAMASSFIKFAEDSKVNPYPNAFIEFWRYSHPSLGKRVEFALGERASRPHDSRVPRESVESPGETPADDGRDGRSPTPAARYRANVPPATRTWPRRTSPAAGARTPALPTASSSPRPGP
jgi:Zn-dependent protease with chaperone function